MKTVNDINGILYRVLSGAGIGHNGGIYQNGQRPAQSVMEDIVIAQIALDTQTCPQSGTWNVNIYVPDMEVSTGQTTELVPDYARMDGLAKAVHRAIVESNTTINGIGIYESSHVILAESGMKQHYVNIRVELTIQID